MTTYDRKKADFIIKIGIIIFIIFFISENMITENKKNESDYDIRFNLTDEIFFNNKLVDIYLYSIKENPNDYDNDILNAYKFADEKYKEYISGNKLRLLIINNKDTILNLSGSIISDIKLKDMNLRNIIFSDSILENIVFENCNFENVYFNEAILNDIVFKNCTFKKCNLNKMRTINIKAYNNGFSNVTMKNSYFKNISLMQSEFRFCNLSYSCINDYILYNIKHFNNDMSNFTKIGSITEEKNIINDKKRL